MASELIKKLKFGTGGYDSIEIHCGTTIPEGNITAPQGSVYIYTGSSIATVYLKRSDSSLNTGWFNTTGNATTTVKGLVNQVSVSADTAEQAAGATPTKAEFDALLAELRDLKTKMRAGDAPILSS